MLRGIITLIVITGFVILVLTKGTYIHQKDSLDNPTSIPDLKFKEIDCFSVWCGDDWKNQRK
jgi:hypothetical protein